MSRVVLPSVGSSHRSANSRGYWKKRSSLTSPLPRSQALTSRDRGSTSHPRPRTRLYALDRPQLVGAFDASTRNDNLRIVDAGGRRFVLRRHRRNRDPERVRFQIRFQRHLEARGFPTAPVVDSRTAAPVVLDAEGRPWTLFELVDGEHFDFSRLDQAREAGRRLAEFHDLADRFTGVVTASLLEDEVRRFVAAPREVVDELRAAFGDGSLERNLRDFRRRLEVIAVPFPAGRLDALPTGWLHNDYHGRNTLFRGDTMAALLDFDKLERGPRASDIVRGVLSFGRKRRGSRVLRPLFARGFLDGYRERRDIAREELAAMPALAELSEAPFAAICRMREANGEDPATAIRRDLQYMRETEAQGAALRRILA
ncbi:MAG: phosphotransferase [Chloroflexi bacterium]|nr:phosphotransferase [Chloroflexota bacterium]